MKTNKNDYDKYMNMSDDERERLEKESERKWNYEHLTELDEMERELRKIEKRRQKINFEKRFARLRKRIAKADAKLKKKGWSEKDVLHSIDNTYIFYSYFDSNNPEAALGVASREYKILTVYLKKLNETLNKYRNELKSKYGINDNITDLPV